MNNLPGFFSLLIITIDTHEVWLTAKSHGFTESDWIGYLQFNNHILYAEKMSELKNVPASQLQSNKIIRDN